MLIWRAGIRSLLSSPPLAIEVVELTSGRKLPPVVPRVDSAGCSTLSMRVMRATPAALMSCGTAPECGLEGKP